MYKVENLVTSDLGNSMAYMTNTLLFIRSGKLLGEILLTKMSSHNDT